MLVENCDVGKRIDVFLHEKQDISRSKIQKLIKNEKVLVCGKVVNNNYKLKEYDEIIILEEEKKETSLKPKNIEIDIVYEDEYLIVINKKSGMVVHPGAAHESDTLVNALIGKYDLKSTNLIRPGIVHRLDKDTSGLMIVAKDDDTLEKLSLMIKNREVKRHYLAIVEGVIMHSTGTIDAPIGRDVNNRQKQAVTEINGKKSITHFKVLKRLQNATLVECCLESGRTHQIRVHMKYINHPVVNDPIYSNKKSTSFGQMLHSKSIEFIHPVTKEKLFFEVEPPVEFQEKLSELSLDV